MDKYELLNYIETDFKEYEEMVLSEEETTRHTKRILERLNGEKMMEDKAKVRVWKKVAAAAVIVIVGMASVTTVSFASEGKIFSGVYTFLNGSKLMEEYDEKTGVTSTTVHMNAFENSPVLLEEGTLYFVADGGREDITNLISEMTPFIGSVEDSQGNIHKFIVGGVPKKQGYGYEENIFDGNGEFMGASGAFGSEVEGIGSDEEPEWLVIGRELIRKSESEEE